MYIILYTIFYYIIIIFLYYYFIICYIYIVYIYTIHIVIYIISNTYILENLIRELVLNKNVVNCVQYLFLKLSLKMAP